MITVTLTHGTYRGMARQYSVVDHGHPDTRDTYRGRARQYSVVDHGHPDTPDTYRGRARQYSVVNAKRRDKVLECEYG